MHSRVKIMLLIIITSKCLLMTIVMTRESAAPACSAEVRFQESGDRFISSGALLSHVTQSSRQSITVWKRRVRAFFSGHCGCRLLSFARRLDSIEESQPFNYTTLDVVRSNRRIDEAHVQSHGSRFGISVNQGYNPHARPSHMECLISCRFGLRLPTQAMIARAVL